ncbi:unnamed protein product [Ectocarpus sp. 6 AP-2014]
MIKQRPISPSLLPTTAASAATPSNGSRFASLRRAVQGRPSCSASARTVCVLLAALCLVLFVAEMKEAPSSIHTSSAAQNSASSEPDPDSAPGTAVVVVKDQEHEEEPQKQAEEVENMPPAAFLGGLRRFESFEEFVEKSRAEDGPAVMPVVPLDGKYVTLPSVIIVGARRSGTSTLFSMLSQHPAVGSIAPEPRPELSSGLMAQDPETFPQEAEWPGDNLEKELPASVLGKLLEEFARPYTVSESRHEGDDAPNLVTTAVSPGYFASHLAPYRLKLALPDVKIVVMLRDPTNRYYSELREALCADEVDWEDIMSSYAMPGASKDYLSDAVLDYSPYDKGCLGEGASAADLWACQKGLEKSHTPLLKGLYASQLERWQRAFGESQVLVVQAEKLFQEPEKTATEVAKFAGLAAEHSFFEFAVDREASCDPRRKKDPKVVTAYSKRKESEPQLRKWYAEHNDMVSELLGEEMGWNDRIRSAFVSPPAP